MTDETLPYIFILPGVGYVFKYCMWKEQKWRIIIVISMLAPYTFAWCHFRSGVLINSFRTRNSSLEGAMATLSYISTPGTHMYKFTVDRDYHCLVLFVGAIPLLAVIDHDKLFQLAEIALLFIQHCMSLGMLSVTITSKVDLTAMNMSMSSTIKSSKLNGDSLTELSIVPSRLEAWDMTTTASCTTTGIFFHEIV